MTTIIEKIELGKDGELQTSPVGYTKDIDLVNKINIDYDGTLGTFIGANRTKLEIGEISINIFFETTNYTHEARINTDSIGDMDLNEITNINQL